MNKIILIIIATFYCNTSNAQIITIEDIDELQYIDSTSYYQKVSFKEISLSEIPKKFHLNTKSLEIEMCLIKNNNLFQSLNWSYIEEIIVINSILPTVKINLSEAKENLKFTLKNVKGGPELIGLSKLSSLRIINAYEVTFDMFELTDKLKILHLENINFPMLKNINDLSGLVELVIVGYEFELEISDLMNLSLLMFKNLKYSPIIKNINTLKSLWLIDISQVNSSTIQNIVKKNNTNLLSIVLNNLKLEEVPNEIYKCKNLEILELDENSISIIDSEILNLDNLKYLSLYDNRIQYLDKSILSLEKLNELNIEINNIDNIQDILLLNKSIFIHYSLQK